MQLTECAEVMDRVRTFFRKGHKSSNKLYYVNVQGGISNSTLNALSTADYQRFEKRWDECDASDAHRLGAAASRYDLAQALIKMPVTDRSGNCDEMASLSAYYANKHYNTNRSCLYIGEISGDGDHVFCLVTKAELSTKSLRSFASVSDFTKAGPAAEWLIIDPWLHVVCRASNYLSAGGAQLDHWGMVGKRISWHAGSQGPGWYPPHGEYKTKFGQAPVKLLPF